MRTKEELEALQAKLKEVMADKNFAEKLLSLEEPEDVKKALEEKMKRREYNRNYYHNKRKPQKAKEKPEITE